MSKKVSVKNLISEKKRSNSLVEDISLMESNRMNMNDLVQHYMQHRIAELQNDNLITIEERYNKLRKINKNSFCRSCTVEVTASSAGRCPFCGTIVKNKP